MKFAENQNNMPYIFRFINIELCYLCKSNQGAMPSPVVIICNKYTWKIVRSNSLWLNDSGRFNAYHNDLIIQIEAEIIDSFTCEIKWNN